MSNNTTVEIPLTQGKTATIDSADFERVAAYKWCTYHNPKYPRQWYAIRSVRVGRGQSRTVRLHRFILNAPAGFYVDHINGNGLDNRRANLRISTSSENACNKPPTIKNKSGYKGIFQRSSGNWSSQIRLSGTYTWLGTFTTPEEAAHAYDAAARLRFGEYAWLNFPDDHHKQSD